MALWKATRRSSRKDTHGRLGDDFVSTFPQLPIRTDDAITTTTCPNGGVATSKAETNNNKDTDSSINTLPVQEGLIINNTAGSATGALPEASYTGCDGVCSRDGANAASISVPLADNVLGEDIPLGHTGRCYWTANTAREAIQDIVWHHILNRSANGNLGTIARQERQMWESRGVCFPLRMSLGSHGSLQFCGCCQEFLPESAPECTMCGMRAPCMIGQECSIGKDARQTGHNFSFADGGGFCSDDVLQRSIAAAGSDMSVAFKLSTSVPAIPRRQKPRRKHK